MPNTPLRLNATIVNRSKAPTDLETVAVERQDKADGGFTVSTSSIAKVTLGTAAADIAATQLWNKSEVARPAALPVVDTSCGEGSGLNYPALALPPSAPPRAEPSPYPQQQQFTASPSGQPFPEQYPSPYPAAPSRIAPQHQQPPPMSLPQAPPPRVQLSPYVGFQDGLMHIDGFSGYAGGFAGGYMPPPQGSSGENYYYQPQAPPPAPQYTAPAPPTQSQYGYSQAPPQAPRQPPPPPAAPPPTPAQPRQYYGYPNAPAAYGGYNAPDEGNLPPSSNFGSSSRGAKYPGIELLYPGYPEYEQHSRGGSSAAYSRYPGNAPDYPAPSSVAPPPPPGNYTGDSYSAPDYGGGRGNGVYYGNSRGGYQSYAPYPSSFTGVDSSMLTTVAGDSKSAPRLTKLISAFDDNSSSMLTASDKVESGPHVATLQSVFDVQAGVPQATTLQASVLETLPFATLPSFARSATVADPSVVLVALCCIVAAASSRGELLESSKALSRMKDTHSN